MIVVKGDSVSEYYASITLPEWKRLGFEIEVFDAYTPDRQPDFKLNFKPYASRKYVNKNIIKEMTSTERGCWNSHAALWLKCIELQKPIMILEHDCYPIYPEHITYSQEYDFVNFDANGSGCYIITPQFAKRLWGVIKKIDKIELGPCGFIGYVKIRHLLKNLILWNEKNVVYPCYQIHDLDIGTSISHYNEGDDKKQINVSKTVKRIVVTKGQKPSYDKTTTITLGK